MCYVRTRGTMIYTMITAGCGMAALVAIVTATEFIDPVERHSVRSRLRGLLFSIMNAGLGVGFFGLVSSCVRALGIAPVLKIDVGGLVGDWAAVLIGLLFFDFLKYWNHRFQHRFLWRIHSLHHSQTQLHAANGYGHFCERGLAFFLFALPLALIQFQFPATPYVVVTACSLLELYIHSPTGAHFGRLSLIVVDNRFHRVHHSIERRHFDRNFGITFSIWDRIFGTACDLAADEWPETGVAGIEPPRSISNYLLFPLRRRAARSRGSEFQAGVI